MTDTTATRKPRPEFRNIHVTQILKYRLPWAGRASIAHRISGVLMFLLLPFVVWLFDTSLTSEISYGQFTGAFAAGLGFLPAWFVKLVTLALIFAYLVHFFVGLRHLWMDLSHDAVAKEPGRVSAMAALGAGALLTAILGYKLFF